MKSLLLSCLVVLSLVSLSVVVQAEVTVPNIFGDHMVLQQKQENKVWGKASPGEKIVVTLEGGLSSLRPRRPWRTKPGTGA